MVGTAQIQPDTEKDYNAHITNFRGAGADVVVFCCEYNPAALFLKQAATLGWTDFGAYGTAGTSNPQLIEIAGADAAEGYISIASYVADIDAASDRSKALSRHIRQRLTPILVSGLQVHTIPYISWLMY